MPLADYICSPCRLVQEELVKRPIPQYVPCEKCGQHAYKRPPVIARTDHSWGDSNGYYDRTLKTYVNNRQERERIMEAKGLVASEDVGKYFFEDSMEKSDAYNAKLDKHADEMFDAFSKCKSIKDQERAWEKLVPAEKVFNGTYESPID